MAKSVTRSVAEFISYALNAPVVAFFTFLALLLAGSSTGFWLNMAVAATFGTVVPIASLYFLLRKGLITDFHASNREARIVPFMTALISYAIGTALLVVIHAAPVVVATMFCYFGNSLAMMLLTIRWKVSIHASGITGPATVLTASLGAPWLLTFLLLIPVGWARVKLEAHNIWQVLAGAVLTVPLTWLQLQLIVNHILA